MQSHQTSQNNHVTAVVTGVLLLVLLTLPAGCTPTQTVTLAEFSRMKPFTGNVIDCRKEGERAGSSAWTYRVVIEKEDRSRIVVTDVKEILHASINTLPNYLTGRMTVDQKPKTDFPDDLMAHQFLIRPDAASPKPAPVPSP